MNGWAEDALRQAIDLLAGSGRNDLALDLNRVLATIALDDLEILRNADADQIADEIVEAGTLSKLVDILKKLPGLMSVDHCTLHVVSEVIFASFTTRVLTTYPEEWVSRYVERRYFFIDPVIAACREKERGFFWDDLNVSSGIVRPFWIDAQAFGIGPSGYSVPITTERGDRLAISVSSSASAEDFRQTFTRHQSDLLNLGIFLSDAFCSLASEDFPASTNLTDDQMMVLRAIAAGASEADLRNQPFLYGSYSTIERSVCSLFGTKTAAQAAILAAKIGLLHDAPLMKSDILTASDKSGTAHVVFGPTVQSLRRLAQLHTVLPTEEPMGLCQGGELPQTHSAENASGGDLPTGPASKP
jgi:autoinducer binding domain-containing protein